AGGVLRDCRGRARDLGGAKATTRLDARSRFCGLGCRPRVNEEASLEQVAITGGGHAAAGRPRKVDVTRAEQDKRLGTPTQMQRGSGAYEANTCSATFS